MHINEVPKNQVSCFRGRAPVLCYTWKKKIGESFSPPRILHSHDDVTELLLITAGSANYTVEGHKYAVKEGDIIVINAGAMHDEDARLAANTTAMLIGLKDVQVEGLPDGMLIPAETFPVLALGERFSLIQSMIQIMHDMLDTDAVQNAETCQFLAAGIASMLVQMYRRRGIQPQPAAKNEMLTERIQKYIDAHYQEDFTLQTLGEAVHINPFYAAHIFKESTGYSPMQYAIRLRIGQAQALLAGTNYTITQIAGMVGYDNSSHFNTMFTKYIGISPGKYRKIFLEPSGE